MVRSGIIDRRKLLGVAGAAGAAGALRLGTSDARAAAPVSFSTWSAAVDTVKAELAAFEAASGVPVAYANSPFAQYRESSITKFVGGAPVDVMWVSDSWLPEWADAGWLAPISDVKTLMQHNADTDQFCIESMTHKGKQYGLTYYTDYMGFLYNEELLKKAGIAAPPKTWAEVTDQALRIKAAGLSDYPVMISMAQESWLIEFMSALVFSHGGRFTDDRGEAALASPKEGALAALNWVVDAVRKHKVLSPACVETGELAGLKAFGSGQHAFALVAKYRLKMLNDPQQSQIAGKVRQALMPMGEGGSNATVGWMRFYGMTPRARADKEREAAAVKLVEWFGGKPGGAYRVQKALFKDVGLGFGVTSLFADPEIRAGYASFGDVDLIARQQGLARKKDVVTSWFGEWNDVNGTAWQQAILGKVAPEAALKTSAAKWNELKKQA